MQSGIKFGTDGWRAVIAEDFTVDNLRKISQATADYLIKSKGKNSRVVLGYDTRFMSGYFAKKCAEVLGANGIKVVISDKYCPTPCVSFTARHKRYDLGLVITASHNPYYFNGFKIKTALGQGAPKKVTDRVEHLIGHSRIKDAKYDVLKKKKIVIEKDLKGDYLRFIKNYLDKRSLKKLKTRILVDVMYGSSQGLIEEVLGGTPIKITSLRNTVNPYFDGSRPEPVIGNLGKLIHTTRKGKYGLGIAFDGDGDRLAAVLDGGVFLHPQKILPLLLMHLRESRRWGGVVVKTVVGSMLIDRVCKALGIKVVETPIGFKYISAVFERSDVLIGGEEAGGIGVKKYIPERDGLMCACLLLEMIAQRKQKISHILRSMEKEFGRFYYLRRDHHVSGKIRSIDKVKVPRDLLGRKVVRVNRIDGVKFITDRSWLMLRMSGTEPLARVYAEAQSLKEARKLILLGESMVI